MDSTEMFPNQKKVVAETVGFIFEADFFNSVPIIMGFGCNEQHWDVSHTNIMAAAQTVGFRFEENFFLVLIIIGFGCHAQNWDVSPQENGCCRIRRFQVRSRPFQISTDYHGLVLSCTTLKRVTTRKWLLQKPLASDSSRFVQINTDDHKLLLSWTTLRRLKIRRWLLQKQLVSDSKPTSSNQCWKS